MSSVGIHQSFYGLSNSLVDAKSYGFNTLQVFIRNNRNMRSRVFLPENYNDYNRLLPSSGVTDLVVHAPYAMNPASGDEELLKRTRDMIRSDMNILSNLQGRKHYVLHPGSYTEWTMQEGMSRLIDTIHVLSNSYKGTKISVENMAGQGTTLISTLEQIGLLAASCKDIPEFEVCLDTCHLFGSGIEAKAAVTMLSWFNCTDRLGVIHVNDSKNPFGSCKDRHANIGQGCIGIDRLHDELLILHDYAPEAPIILETPEDGLVQDGYLVQNWLH